MKEINTTRLLRRVEKYCASIGGGRHQSGETKFSMEAVGHQNVVTRLRRGSPIGQPLLEKMDTFLTDRGF